MKAQLIRVSVVAVLAAAAACAQSSIKLTANVPFDFVAGGTTLRAGEYVVDHAPISGAIIVKGIEGKGSVVLLTQSTYNAKAPEMSRLVFHRYGDTYFLSEVWGPGKDGRTLTPSIRERELAKNSGQTNNVQVALK